MAPFFGHGVYTEILLHLSVCVLWCVDIFRGCYKGEYGVDPSLFGCHRQADSMYCFCEGDRCNHDQAPPEDDLKNFAL